MRTPLRSYRLVTALIAAITIALLLVMHVTSARDERCCTCGNVEAGILKMI